MPKLTDTQALDAIHAIMDGTEWNADTTEAIADVLAIVRPPLRDPFEDTDTIGAVG